MAHQDEEVLHVSINVNLKAPQGLLQRGLQRQIDLARYGLTLSESGPLEAVSLPASGISYSPSSNTSLSGDELKSEFERWILASAFEDSLELVQSFFEEVRLVYAVLNFSNRGVFTHEEWASEVERPARRFHRLGLPDKFDHLYELYGSDSLPLSVDLVRGMNRVRNCLVHRAGIVGVQDVDESGKLVLEWRRLELFAESKGVERVVGPGHVVKKGERMGLRQTSTIKSFGLGDRVTFDHHEIEEVLWTLFVVSEDVRQCTIRYAQARGVPDAKLPDEALRPDDAGA